MALVFNAGTAKQVQVAKAYFVKYYNNDWSARDACYPVDTPGYKSKRYVIYASLVGDSNE